MSPSDTLRLVALVFTAVSFIVVGDTAGKLLTGAGVAPLLVAWSRFALGGLVVLPLCRLTRADWPGLRDWRVLLRAALIGCAVACILTALRTEPIANVFGAFFIGPVVAYLLAILFLGERPSLRRSVMLALGFTGVMLVVKPGFGTSPGMLFALAAGCFYGTFLVMTRLVAGVFRPRFLLFSQLLVGALVLTGISLIQYLGEPASMTMPVPDLRLVALIVVSALGSATGNYLLVLASKQAEASLIAPLVYTQLITATAVGVLVFGDWPDLVALLGLALILGSGIGSLFFGRSGQPAISSGPG